MACKSNNNTCSACGASGAQRLKNACKVPWRMNCHLFTSFCLFSFAGFFRAQIQRTYRAHVRAVEHERNREEMEQLLLVAAVNTNKWAVAVLAAVRVYNWFFRARCKLVQRRAGLHTKMQKRSKKKLRVVMGVFFFLYGTRVREIEEVNAVSQSSASLLIRNKSRIRIINARTLVVQEG